MFLTVTMSALHFTSPLAYIVSPLGVDEEEKERVQSRVRLERKGGEHECEKTESSEMKEDKTTREAREEEIEKGKL